MSIFRKCWIQCKIQWAAIANVNIRKSLNLCLSFWTVVLWFNICADFKLAHTRSDPLRDLVVPNDIVGHCWVLINTDVHMEMSIAHSSRVRLFTEWEPLNVLRWSTLTGSVRFGTTLVVSSLQVPRKDPRKQVIFVDGCVCVFAAVFCCDFIFHLISQIWTGHLTREMDGTRNLKSNQFKGNPKKKKKQTHHHRCVFVSNETESPPSHLGRRSYMPITIVP